MRLALVGIFVMLATPARAVDPDPWLGRDKAFHFGASALIAGGGYAAASLLTDRAAYRALAGAGLGALAGFGKEAFDAARGGDASGRDLAWDAAGTLVGVAVAWAVDRWVFARAEAR